MGEEGFPRKVLVSPGYGAGWSSWCSRDDVAQYVAEYEPIIEFLENNGDKKSEEFQDLLKELKFVLNNKYNYPFYDGGARDLEVRIVSGPYKIYDYDGSEKLEEQANDDLWFY